MTPCEDLARAARARLADARALLSKRRHDAAIYLCGYAVEIALKVRICRTLKWAEFPSTAREFEREGLRSFQTHSLGNLVKLSGVESHVKSHYMAEWPTVGKWDPEARHAPGGSATRQEADFVQFRPRIDSTGWKVTPFRRETRR